MTELFDVLGRHVSSPEATAAFARYPKLAPQVEDVEPGDDDMPPVRYLRSRSDGLLVKLSAEGEILAIFLMGEGREGFSQFRGELPAKLTFASKPPEVLKALGAPAYNRPPGKVGGHEHGELFRFDRPGHSLHFQFRGDRGGIELITAMTAKSVPGRSVAPQAGAR